MATCDECKAKGLEHRTAPGIFGLKIEVCPSLKSGEVKMVPGGALLGGPPIVTKRAVPGGLAADDDGDGRGD